MAVGYNWLHAPTSAVTAADLRTEYLSQPIGIDAVKPRLSWVPVAKTKARRQWAYQIQVAGSAGSLRAESDLLWDSGQIRSERSWGIRYTGSALSSGRSYAWRVRLWDRADAQPVWSEPATWQMGLLDEEAWGRAAWIAAPTSTAPAALLLRRSFQLPSGSITEATLTVAGVGFHVPYLNGERASDTEMAPAWTDYIDRIAYTTYDVTGAVRGGTANVLGVALAGGWYHPNSPDSWGFEAMPYVDREKLRLRLDVRHQGGSTTTIVSDSEWQWATGDVTYASVRGGEDIDHTRDAGPWTTVDAEVGGFAPVAVGVAPKGRPALVATAMPAERRTTTIATTVKKTTSGYLYTLDENVSAALTVKLTGTKGTTVRLQVGEGLAGNRVDPAWNNLNDKVPGSRWQQINLTLGSSQLETFETTFTYFAGLYIDLKVTKGKLSAPPELTVHAVHTDVASAGSFASSDRQLNALHEAFRRTYLNNLHGYPMDCPQRERLGYGGDAGVLTPTALLNFDAVTVYEKWMVDFRDAQATDGFVPFTVPAYDGRDPYWWSPWWGNAIATIPVDLYRLRGDTAVLERQYPAMQAYIAYLVKHLNAGIWADNGFPSDHESLDHGDSRQFNTLAVAVALRAMIDAAAVLDQQEDAETYGEHLNTVRSAFNTRWFDASRGTYARQAVGSAFRIAPQAVLATTLANDLVPEGQAEAVLTSLKADIAEPAAGAKYANHLITGIVGTRYLFDVLTDADMADIAYRLLTQQTYPGVLPGVLAPGGTLHERIADSGLSHDHPMFGSYDSWLYRGLAGLRVGALAADGMLRVRPGLVDGVDWVEATVSTTRGPAASRWERFDGGVRYTITVPVGASAEVSVVATAGAVTVDGTREATTTDQAAADRQVLRLRSGTYVVEAG
ncbi:MAG: hypothetical protein HKP61_08105 [Dactylosporangium sp.]|nr:alpha-L-rhamnosidase N-terminal domain-containing protein [Dactylosporangium sp.]NNJ60900.1 hypothetical protein [Dactylosporangium sp.]